MNRVRWVGQEDAYRYYNAFTHEGDLTWPHLKHRQCPPFPKSST
jgi:hypothetical protein